MGERNEDPAGKGKAEEETIAPEPAGQDNVAWQKIWM